MGQAPLKISVSVSAVGYDETNGYQIGETDQRVCILTCSKIGLGAPPLTRDPLLQILCSFEGDNSLNRIQMTCGWLEIVFLHLVLDYDGFSQCNRSNLRQF
mgnify:CR=1 FL=1